MIKRNSILKVLPGAATALAMILSQSSAFASNTSALLGASGFNVFTLSNFTAAGTDVGGRIAVGGNFNPGGANGASTFQVVSNINGPVVSDTISNFDFVVGGNLFNGGTSMSGGGSVWVGGNATWSNMTLPGNLDVKGTYANAGGGSVAGTIYAGTYSGPAYLAHAAFSTQSQQISPVDFVTAATQLPAYSTQLSTTAATGTVNKSVDANNKGLTLTATNCTLCVITLTSAELSNALTSGAGGVNITAPSGSTVLVNVNGATVNINGSSITINGTTKQEVLWNFYNATLINYQIVGWQGSILAPGATFAGVNNYSSGNVDGQLIVNVDSAAVEIHNFLFDGSLPSYSVTATPEPSSWALGVGGLALVVLASWRNATAKR